MGNTCSSDNCDNCCASLFEKQEVVIEKEDLRREAQPSESNLQSYHNRRGQHHKKKSSILKAESSRSHHPIDSSRFNQLNDFGRSPVLNSAKPAVNQIKSSMSSHRYSGPQEQQHPEKASLSQESDFQDDKIRSNGAANSEVSYLLKNIGFVIKIQAWMRGSLARRQVQFMKSKQIGSSSYFTQGERRETLPKNKQEHSQPSGILNQTQQRPMYKYETGATYEGEWLGPSRDGYGTQIWPDGAKYEGEWKNGRACGKGKFIHADGDVYQGEWLDDKANGLGTYQHVTGAKYSGQWKDDLQHGLGVETWTDRSKYQGLYSFGRKHGFGIYEWSDGSRYVGQWEENMIGGIGIYQWLDGRAYEGEWRENNMEGVGIYRWNDGRTYHGEYLEDKKHGYGVYKWADGRQYAGCWSNGQQHGLGIYNIPSEGRMKHGLWEDGKRIQWFGPGTQQLINEQQLDYRQHFLNPDSSAGLLGDDVAFAEPKDFQARIDQLVQKASATRKQEAQLANDLNNKIYGAAKQ